MFILKDFINENVVPLLPWALIFLGLVVFCAEFVWTDRKTLSQNQKETVKSFFACSLAGVITVYWAHRILPPAKQPLLIACVILPVLIFFNNNFLKKHDIPHDWQIILYVSLVFVPLAVKSPLLLVTGCAVNCVLYALAATRSSFKKVDKTVKQVDTRKVKKNKTLYGGAVLLVCAVTVSLVLAWSHSSPVTFLSSVILCSISIASFVLWYVINDKSRIHWFTVFEIVFIFLPFLFNPFEHFWIGSSVIIASLVWNEYFSVILAKKYKKDRFFIFSLGLELMSILLTVGIICAGFHYTTVPFLAIVIVNLASGLALFLYYVFFGTENYWVYTLLTVALVFVSVFMSPFGSFWIAAAVLCVLLPFVVASFREYHWLLIAALAGLMVAVAYLCLMILLGQMDFDKIFEHVHVFGSITGKGMIQADIIPFALKIGLLPVLCIAVPFVTELVLGTILFVKKNCRKKNKKF